ncbi:dihydrofolate reductase [Candidatus Saccharibacteria bacterium]|nr:dihydrofolate reductase [Candidatus Saccharibacteria bacterium]
MKYMIVAYGSNRVIGSNGVLPWQGKMAADMKRFKEITTGNVVIMGRKTFESIGRPLPNRQNIVISRSDFKSDGVTIVSSIDEAYREAEVGKDIFVIGGGQIYELALGSVDKILATEIDAEFDGDVVFPNIMDEWQVESRQDFRADDKNSYDYSFVVYRRP